MANRRIPPRRVRRKTTPSKDVAAQEPDVRLLEFIAGLVLLGADATEGQRLALARSIGLKAPEVARMFGKTPGAAQKALQRAR